MAKAKRVQVLDVQVADFIEKFAANVWPAAVDGVGCRSPYAEAYRSLFGFHAAFRVVFGLEVEKFELDNLKLNFLEREHQCLLAHGVSGTGFTYPAWWPGGMDLLKLRYRLGVPGGVKNRAEWDALVEAARDAAFRRAA